MIESAAHASVAETLYPLLLAWRVAREHVRPALRIALAELESV